MEPVPPLRPVPGHDDGTMDAVAAVEAQLSGDWEGLRVILANCDPVSVAASSLKLCAELYADALELAGDRTGIPPREVSPGAFRRWALLAVRRS
jgi:hypothetical protein